MATTTVGAAPIKKAPSSSLRRMGFCRKFSLSWELRSAMSLARVAP